jgi:predicted dienelactone hydrolase
MRGYWPVSLSFLARIAVIAAIASGTAEASPVGETHRVTTEPTARLRDAAHRAELRITIWYPAAPDAIEQQIAIGPPGKPLFDVGSAAPDASFAPGGPRLPVILLSHSYGGSARMIGWFGIAMARAGYIVVAVDHPGNNGIDRMTVAGALLRWDRAEDLRAALEAAGHDPFIGPHMDLSRIGAAGFSVGGFTALLAAGVRVDPAHFAQFCLANPGDSVCQPPREEFDFTPQDRDAVLKRPEIQAETARATASHAIPGLRAAFAIAPLLVQDLAPASLEHLHMPVAIILGDADTAAPPPTNGLAAAKLLPNASLIRLPGVGHNDFLATCTETGRANVPACKTSVAQDDTHRRAIDAAMAFFGQHLRGGEAANGL